MHCSTMDQALASVIIFVRCNCVRRSHIRDPSSIYYFQFDLQIATGQTFNHIYSVENFPDAYGKGYSMYTPVNETTIQAFIYT